MLPKKSRIKKKNDFEAVFKKGKIFRNKFFILRMIKNDFRTNRLAIMVSQKVSKKAVERNKIRRRVSFIMESIFTNLKNNFDLVFLASPQIKNLEFKELEKEIKDFFKKCFNL